MLNILLFVGVYLGGIYRAIFTSPMYAVILYQLVYFFYPKFRWWGAALPNISYSFVVVVLMLVLTVVLYKQYSSNHIFTTPSFKWFYLLILSYGFAYFFAVLKDPHLKSSIEFIKMGIIITLMYRFCDKAEKLHWMLYAYIFGSFYIGVQAWQVGRNAMGRVENIGMVESLDGNGTAAAIAPSLVFCIYYFWQKKIWWQRGMLVIAGVFIANGLILINSRGAFLAAGVSILLYIFNLLFSSSKIKKQKRFAVGIIFIGLIGLSQMLDQAFYDRIGTMKSVEVNEEAESGATRMLFWLAAIDMAKDYPLGKGYRGFEFYSDFYLPEGLDTGKSRHRAVHSTWFEILTEGGVISFICFIMLIYSIFRLSSIAKKELKSKEMLPEYYQVLAMQCALICFMISMTFVNRARAEILHWLILFIAIAYNLYVTKNNHDTKKSQLEK